MTQRQRAKRHERRVNHSAPAFKQVVVKAIEVGTREMVQVKYDRRQKRIEKGGVIALVGTVIMCLMLSAVSFSLLIWG